MAKRRLNGEGCLYRKNGRFYFRQNIKDANGEVHQVHFPCGQNFKQAFDILEEYRKKNGIGIDTSSSFNDWLDTWLAKYATGKAASTNNLYKIIINTHIRPQLGGFKLSDLKPLVFADLFTRLSKNLAPRTVNLIRSILNTVLRQAIDDELIDRNPLKKAKRVKIEPAKRRILSKNEFSAVLSFCLASEYKFPCLFMMFAGLRRGEALGVSWPAINLERKTLTVKQQIVETSGGFQLCPLKTGKSYRTITLPEIVIRELLKQPVRKRNGLLYGSVDCLQDPRRLTRYFKRISVALKIDGLRPHDLRHTHASILLQDKVSLPAVSARLGHASIRITGDIYAHEIPYSQDEAILSMDRFIEVTANNRE